MGKSSRQTSITSNQPSQSEDSMMFADYFKLPAAFTFGQKLVLPEQYRPHVVHFHFEKAIEVFTSKDTVIGTLNGLLNSEKGGAAIFGIDDDWIVRGISTKFEAEIRSHIIKRMHKVWPPIVEDSEMFSKAYQLYFVPVQKAPIDDPKAVVVIVLKPLRNDTLYAVSQGGCVYFRDHKTGKVEGPLNNNRIREIIEQRLSRPKQQSNGVVSGDKMKKIGLLSCFGK